MTKEHYGIGALSKATGVKIETIRYVSVHCSPLYSVGGFLPTVSSTPTTEETETCKTPKEPDGPGSSGKRL